jgi:hypothetical protein
VYAKAQIAIFRPVFEISRLERSVSRGHSEAWSSQNDEGRSVSNQLLGLARIDFWRRRGIASLPQYPKKTDRLEQRQGGGVKTRAASFCFSTRKALLADLFSALN